MTYKVMCYKAQLHHESVVRTFGTAVEVLQFLDTLRADGSPWTAAVTSPEHHPVFENELLCRASRGA